MKLEQFAAKGAAAQKAVDEIIQGIEHGRKAEIIIWRLILSFPCLEKKFWQGPWLEKGKVCFDPDRLFECSGKWSSGEQLCVLFVLNVWNPGYAKSKGGRSTCSISSARQTTAITPLFWTGWQTPSGHEREN